MMIYDDMILDYWWFLDYIGIIPWYSTEKKRYHGFLNLISRNIYSECCSWWSSDLHGASWLYGRVYVGSIVKGWYACSFTLQILDVKIELWNTTKDAHLMYLLRSTCRWVCSIRSYTYNIAYVCPLSVCLCVCACVCVGWW